MDAGVPRYLAMQMATRNLAEAMGLSEGIGTISVGQRAHFALYTADPLAIALDVWRAHAHHLRVIAHRIAVLQPDTRQTHDALRQWRAKVQSTRR